MSVAAKARNAVGIKELKDRTSEIVDSVVRQGRAVEITKHGKVIARILPVRPGGDERLVELGRVQARERPSWDSLKLITPGVDASVAVQAILKDRE